MTRKDANKREQPADISPDQRLEAEEIESRRALSLSIMHHAVQASSVTGSSGTQFASSRSKEMHNVESSAEIEVESQSQTAASTSVTPIEQHFDEEGWNIDEYYTTPKSNKLNMNTRNRRSCMYICALLASVAIGVLLGAERLGFTKVQHLEDHVSIISNKPPVQKLKYSGNYTDMNTMSVASAPNTPKSSTSDTSKVQTKTRSSSKFYKKEAYSIPDNIEEEDDFVDATQVMPTLINTNLGDIFDEEKDNMRVLVIDDVPYFWIIPRNGGNSVRYVLSYCFKSVLACEAGSRTNDEKVLEVFEEDGCNYVNVNTETSSGIKRAKDLNLVNSGLAYAVFSSRLNEIASIFNTGRRARSFTLLRHPVERAISEFYQEQARNPKLALVSLERYLEDNPAATATAVGEDNYIVRSLTNKPEAALTSYDLDLAMLILKKKFLIGLVDEMAESIKRFRYYFAWQTKGLKGVDECILTFSSASPRKKPIFSKSSSVWKILEKRNSWDTKLYDFALHLFDVQGLLLSKKHK